MAKPYSYELRQRVVNAYESGEGTQEEIAERFQIARSTLVEWLWLKAGTGDVKARSPGGGNPSPVAMKTLQSIISKRPDATSFEVTASYNRSVARKDRVHRSSVLRALARGGFVFKKNASVHWSKTNQTFS